jgi:hypothetical protein
MNWAPARWGEGGGEPTVGLSQLNLKLRLRVGISLVYEVALAGTIIAPRYPAQAIAMFAAWSAAL